MSGSIWRVRGARTAVLASIVLLAGVDAVSAVPPTLNSSGLTPQQCYRRDSDCTQFCGEVTGDLRYECFGICDRMLDRCLETGEWSDSLVADPGTGQPPDKKGLLSGFFMRMMMILGDTDRDGVLSAKEIQSVKDRVFRGVDSNSTPAPPAAK